MNLLVCITLYCSARFYWTMLYVVHFYVTVSGAATRKPIDRKLIYDEVRNIGMCFMSKWIMFQWNENPSRATKLLVITSISVQQYFLNMKSITLYCFGWENEKNSFSYRWKFIEKEKKDYRRVVSLTFINESYVCVFCVEIFDSFSCNQKHTMFTLLFLSKKLFLKLKNRF